LETTTPRHEDDSMRKLITGMALVALAIPAAAVADGSSAAQG